MVPAFDKPSRKALPACAAFAAAIALSGCVGAPTYGTGKPADQQLLEDVTGVLSIGPKNKPQIEYKPRPELVKPADTTSLPAPQDSVVTAGNPAWPESPEQRRQRIRSDATLNRDDLDFKPEVVDTVALSAPKSQFRRTRGDDTSIDGSSLVEGSATGQRAEFNRRLAMSTQGSATQRRFLSEPPLEYRTPSATAPAGDIGEDEWRKKKRLEQGTKKNKNWSLGDLWPF